MLRAEMLPSETCCESHLTKVNSMAAGAASANTVILEEQIVAMILRS